MMMTSFLFPEYLIVKCNFVCVFAMNRFGFQTHFQKELLTYIILLVLQRVLKMNPQENNHNLEEMEEQQPERLDPELGLFLVGVAGFTAFYILRTLGVIAFKYVYFW